VAEEFGMALEDLDGDARGRLWERLHASHTTWLAARK
jgi:hypothetical protein